MMTVVEKEPFDYWFFVKRYGRLDFKEKLGVSDKTFQNSYQYHYPDRSERAKFAGERIAQSQRRRNSNAKNTGKPRIVIEKTILEELLLDGKSIEAISKNLGVAPQTVKRNIDYHQIATDKGHYQAFLSYSNIDELRRLDEFFGTNLLQAHSKNERDVQGILDTLFVLDYELREMQETLRKVRRNTTAYAKSNNVTHNPKRFPGSRTNFLYGKAFHDLGYGVEYEFFLDGKFFDIRLEGINVLVEVDSSIYHQSETQVTNDKLKNAIARNNGFSLVRITPQAEKYQGIKTQVQKCLQNLKSSGLLP